MDSAYARGQRWRDKFRDRMALQRLRLSDLQADGHTPVPDQGIIFDQNSIPQDSHDHRLRRDPTHEPTESGSPPWSTVMDLMVVMEVVAVNHHPMVIVNHDRVDVAVGTVVPRDR